MHCNTFLYVLLSLILGFTNAMPTPDRVVEVKADTITDMSGQLSARTVATSASTNTNTVAPTHTAPSTCQTYYPTVMRTLLEAEPDIMQNNTANTTRAFHVAQSVSHSDNVKYDRIQQHVVFDNIAPGSWDCQLMVSWPDKPNGDMSVDVSSRRGSSATSSVSLDVYSASYNASAYASTTKHKGAKTGRPNDGPFATWASMMGALRVGGNQLSSKGDTAKGQDRGLSPVNAKLTYFSTVAVNPGEYGVTVNSEECPSSHAGRLQFLFEMPSTDSRDASVSFFADNQKGAGIFLLADC